MSRHSNKPAEEAPRYRGLAVAGAFLCWATACLFIPSLLDTSGTGTTIWYVVGVLLAVIAVAGGLTEAAKLTRAEFTKDFGVALIVGAFAVACFVAANEWRPASPFSGILKGTGLAFGAIAIYGFLDGVAQAAEPARRRARQRRAGAKNRLVAAVVALLGLITAIVNLVAAVAR
jgi:hypothetical protein